MNRLDLVLVVVLLLESNRPNRGRGRNGGYPEHGSQRLISKRPFADGARSPQNGIAGAQPERGLKSAHRRCGINSALRDRNGARCTFSCEVVTRKGEGIHGKPLSLFRMHWDHEPVRRNSGAGVSPASSATRARRPRYYRAVHGKREASATPGNFHPLLRGTAS